MVEDTIRQYNGLFWFMSNIQHYNMNGSDMIVKLFDHGIYTIAHKIEEDLDVLQQVLWSSNKH